MSEQKNNAPRPINRTAILVGAVAVVLAGALIGFLVSQLLGRPNVQRGSGSASAGLADDEGFDSDTILLDGVTYVRNTSLKTILLLGIDESQEYIEDYDEDTYGNGARADAIVVLILDTENETIHALEVPRDCMVDVDVYNFSDQYLYTAEMQLTLQYAVAASMTRGNWLMKNKVAEVLYGVPMGAAMALTMDGIPTMVEALGGITVTFPKDYTDIDPLFAQGATLTLDGEQAERFIHYRDITVTGSNLDRVERHMLVMRALAGRFKGMGSTQIELLQAAAAPYLESDVDAETLALLAQYTFDDEISVVPGAYREGFLHDEYYIDEEALRRLVVELFYLPAA